MVRTQFNIDNGTGKRCVPSFRQNGHEKCWRRTLVRAGEGQFEEGLGDAVVVVAEELSFVDEVAGDGFDAEVSDAVQIGFDGCLAFAGVLGEEGGRNGGGIDEGVVEEFGRCAGCSIAAVLQHFFDVLGCGEAERFVSLCHKIANVHARGAGGGYGLWDASYQQVGDERRVERAGAESDEVSAGDGVEGAGEGFGVGGFEHEFEDAVRAGGDAGFAADKGAVVHACH